MKRFTDAEKWLDPWFRNLTPEGKIFWLFLLDNCDIAGVWERDDAFFQFVSGISAPVDDHLKELSDRILALDEKRILVPKFVPFQQGGGLNDRKPFHRGIFKILEKLGLEQQEDGMVMPLNGKAMPLESHRHAIAMPTSNSNSLGNSKSKERAQKIPESLNTPEFREAWKAYLDMRKENNWGTLKPTTLKSKFKQFEEIGLEESVQALKTSVLQGYRGVFPSNDKRIKQDDNDRNYDDPV